MPRKDPTYPHYLTGPSRLCDLHFRHLRHENIEPIIDACFHGLQTAVEPPNGFLISGTKFVTPRGVSYSLFTNAIFESALFDLHNGAAVVVSYDCPPQFRGRAMHTATIFEERKLCALIVLHEDNREVNVILCDILMRHSTVSSPENIN